MPPAEPPADVAKPDGAADAAKPEEKPAADKPAAKSDEEGWSGESEAKTQKAPENGKTETRTMEVIAQVSAARASGSDSHHPPKGRRAARDYHGSPCRSARLKDPRGSC